MAQRGRPYFRERPEKVDNSITLTEREYDWLCFANRHGDVSSQTFYEYSKDTHSSYQWVNRCLNEKLFMGGFMYRPAYQLGTYNTDINHLVYRPTKKGEDLLKSTGDYVERLKRAGNSDNEAAHDLMISTITAMMDIMCRREGYTYIPGHDILKDKPLKADVKFKWKNKEYTKALTPDSLFAIDYGGSYLAFALEADRATEPAETKTPHRKSALRNIKQYQAFKKLYKEHYGLNCPLITLTITVSEARMNTMLDLVKQEIGDCSHMVFGYHEDFKPPFWKPPTQLCSHLFTNGLKRSGYEDFYIKRDPV